MHGARSRVDVAFPPIHADTKINRAIVSRTYIRSVYAVQELRYPGMSSGFLDRSIFASVRRSLYRGAYDRSGRDSRARVTAFKCIHITLYPTFVHIYIYSVRTLIVLFTAR